MDNQIQEFEGLLRKKLESIKFEIPQENLANLLIPFRKLVEISSLEKLQCDVETHGSILNELSKDAPDFNLWNISFLLNTLTRFSPKDLEVKSFIYNKMLFYSTDLATNWNKVVAPIQKKLQVDFKSRLVVEAKKNGTKPNLIIQK
jgi:hypothetical protein